MQKIATFIIAYPKSVLLFLALLTVLAIFPASNVRTDFNLEGFYPPDDALVVDYQNWVDEFGRDDTVIMLAWVQDSLLKIENLHFLQEFGNSINKLSHVEEVQSLWTVSEIYGDGENIRVNELLSEEKILSKSYEELSGYIHSQIGISDFLINKNNSVAAILIRIENGENGYENRNTLIKELQILLAKYPDKEFKITGIPYFRNQYISLLNSEIIFYIAFSSILIIALLWYMYRSALGLFLPMLIVWLTILFTVALLELTGGFFEIMSSTIAPILLSVGVADSIHMISKYDDARRHGFKNKKAISETFITLGSATFLTSITTAIGFATLISSSVVPMKRFGLYTAAGVLIAFGITMLLLPALLRVTNSKQIFKDSGGKLYPYLGKQLLWLSHFNKKYYKAIIASFAVSTLLFAFGIPGLQVNGYIFDDVGRGSVLIQDNNYISEQLSPPFPMEVMIETGAEQGIFNPDFMYRLHAFEVFFDSFPEIKKVTSAATFFSHIHKQMNVSQTPDEILPRSEALNAQYALLLELGDENPLESFTNFEYSKARVSALTLDAGSRRIVEIRDSLQSYLSQHFPDEQYTITGSTFLSANLVEKMVSALAYSIMLAIFCISLVMLALFKNVKMIAISLIPNVLPLLVIAGGMGYFGIDIKPSTAVIFTIAFGIAVDDSIHYLARLRVELLRGIPMDEALTITTQKTGRSIIITSLILLAGFGALVTSQFTSTMLMGILVSSTIFVALLADLMLLPALFHAIKPELLYSTSSNAHNELRPEKS